MSIEIGVIIGLSVLCSISFFFNLRKGGVHFDRTNGPINVNYAERDIHMTQETSTDELRHRRLLEAEFHIIQRTLYGLFLWLEPDTKLRVIREIGQARRKLNNNISHMTGSDEPTAQLRVQAARRLEQEFTKIHNGAMEPPDDGKDVALIAT